MAKRTTFDDVSTISQTATKIVAIIALVLIIWIDAQNAQFDAKDIELLLAGFVGGTEVVSQLKKARK